MGVNINLNGKVPNGIRVNIKIVDQRATSDWINAQVTNVADINTPDAIQASAKLSRAPKAVDNIPIAVPTNVEGR